MSSDQEPKQQPKKMVAIPADLYEFFEKRAARNGRPVETIIEAVLASRHVQISGGSSDEILAEYNRRMRFTSEEHRVAALRTHAEVREILDEEEAKASGDAQDAEKDSFDA